MMYDSFCSSNTTNRRVAPGDSPLRENHRMAPPTPPSPRHFSSKSSPERRFIKRKDSEIPWEDRKPAAKPMAKSGNDGAYNHAKDDTFRGASQTDIEVEVDIEGSISHRKDGILFPKNSPRKPKPIRRSGNGEDIDSSGDDNGSESQHDTESCEEAKDGSDRMTRCELLLVSSAFAIIVIIAITITFVFMARETFAGDANKNANMSKSNQKNKNGDEMTPSPTSLLPNTPPYMNGGGDGVTGTTQSPKLSIQEEWELVYSALRDNTVTSVLLTGRDAMEQTLPYDLAFYEHLVSGMVFSEKDRDWIPAPRQDEIDDLVDNDSSMSMSGIIGEFGSEKDDHRAGIAVELTPNQKATSWLLFHDERKDPNESVWRWAMASIYYKMGGHHWSFYYGATSGNKWFTSAPLCEWERMLGSSGCDKQKQATGTPLLPVELDFDNTKMAGSIAIEFALLLQPTSSTSAPLTKDSTVSTNTILRSITLSDNRLTGTIPGDVFRHLMPSLGKLYLDNNQLEGTIPLELGGLDTLYVQNNDFAGDWSLSFCGPGDMTVDDFGLDCDKIECTCCDILQCYYSM